MKQLKNTDGKKLIQVKVDKDLHFQFKRACLDRGTTITEQVRELAIHFVSVKEEPLMAVKR